MDAKWTYSCSARCKSKVLLSRKSDSSYVITTFKECHNPLKCLRKKTFTPAEVATTFAHQLSPHLQDSVKSFAVSVSELGLPPPSYLPAWRTRRLIENATTLTEVQSFSKLPALLNEIQQTNASFQYEISWTSELHFVRCHVMFPHANTIFEHSRPLLYLDGTFMKLNYQQVLLVACSIDGGRRRGR
jgi:hypothetical protein